LRPAPGRININKVKSLVAGGAATEKRVRAPVVEGLFYPEDAAGVLAYMRGAGLEKGKGGTARAIIAPHGAWEISGSLAASAFAAAAGRARKKSPSRVVIMGPMHHSREEGIFLSNSHSFQTPLGDIPVDREASEWLESYSPLIKVNDIPHLSEHSIEVLLPFVKYCFPRAAIVPVLMGGKRVQHTRALANALRAVFQPEMENTLIVVSFNLVVHSGKTAALNMAGECRQLFVDGKSGELCTALQDGRFASCGGPLLAALLQSGLVDSTRPCLASDSLLSSLTDTRQAVYYSAFSFE